MGKRFASFYRCLAFARFWNVKFWRSFIKCQYFNDGWTDFHKNILGFFRKPGKLGSHTESKWWPGRERWPKRPTDPVPCLMAVDERPKVSCLIPQGTLPDTGTNVPTLEHIFCRPWPHYFRHAISPNGMNTHSRSYRPHYYKELHHVSILTS